MTFSIVGFCEETGMSGVQQSLQVLLLEVDVLG